MELTPAQLRQKAIQHTIASTFADQGGAQMDILIAAVARVARARNHGKPLALVTASAYMQALKDALTTNEYI